jgi:GrpB-like predicted nucleotidyltransferase (UPF0157 family)
LIVEMSRRVEVIAYHTDWPAQFEAEAALLRNAFGNTLVTVYHFGSTAIPGTSAKPIIDILLTVKDINCADDERILGNLRDLGYNAVGEYGIPGRRFFYKGTYDVRTHHLHVYQQDNSHILRHIAFRDYLRTHPITAHQYSRLKEDLARAFPEDMDRYIEGKNDFVRQQELAALDWWSKYVHPVDTE